jgi:hypothetical protein
MKKSSTYLAVKEVEIKTTEVISSHLSYNGHIQGRKQ